MPLPSRQTVRAGLFLLFVLTLVCLPFAVFGEEFVLPLLKTREQQVGALTVIAVALLAVNGWMMATTAGQRRGAARERAFWVLGQPGFAPEERAAAFIADNVTKPVVGYVAGFTAPEGKTMGHAGAIVSGSSGTAAAKKEALEAVGVRVGQTPSETARLMRALLRG